ncbi:MAG: hypothetical protein RIA08_19615 [Roseovarius sp.]|uniref:hypothetical protein n=1 Tax=Roseovarius sp. TaxID=1486281 RepID=UPI0032ECE5E8
MKFTIRKTFLAAAAAAFVVSAGPGATPAMADPNFSNIVNQFIGHAIDRHDRRGFDRGYRRAERVYRHRGYDRHHRHVRRHYETPYERQLRGIYNPRYDINPMMQNNYWGNRH